MKNTKKAAMFGLDARVKKLCHPEFISGSHEGNYQRAAMFGLDARVALAIFGALSVITGTVLYKALQEAKVTAIITELEEVGKAYDQYLFDTGLELEVAYGDKFVNTDKLIENVTVPTSGWKGPYLPYDDWPVVSKHVMDHPSYSGVFITEARGLSGANTACSVSNDCYIWPGISGLSMDLIKQIDKVVDNGDGNLDGKIRYWDNDDYIFYQYRPVLHD
ncbi:MAG: hypothetical protein GY793_03045 [Proteobacteria bacterium]|nr:hypothetical protein [Pseudomonadota bacterium]